MKYIAVFKRNSSDGKRKEVEYTIEAKNKREAQKRVAEIVGDDFLVHHEFVGWKKEEHMTITELKQKHLEACPDSHFFDRETLKFFGQTMRDLKVTGQVTVKRYSGKEARCWEVRSISRLDGVKMEHFHYFDTTSFKEVFGDVL